LVKLTEEQIKTVMKETGATRDYVVSMAKNIPERVLVWFPGRTVLTVWACARAVLILGPARKVFWSITCTVLSHPIIHL